MERRFKRVDPSKTTKVILEEAALGSFVKLPRQFFDAPMIADSASTLIYLYLLSRSSVADQLFEGIEIGCGQCLTSIQGISHKVHKSRWTVKRSLAKLVRAELISIERVTREKLRITVFLFIQMQSNFLRRQEATGPLVGIGAPQTTTCAPQTTTCAPQTTTCAPKELFGRKISDSDWAVLRGKTEAQQRKILDMIERRNWYAKQGRAIGEEREGNS